MPAPYAPDDARLTIPALHFLRSSDGRHLLQAVAALPDPVHPTVSQVAALRKTFPSDYLHAALILTALQPKAQGKFPDIPFVWSPPEALEQASSSRVAQHKARRFALAARDLNAMHPVPRLFDLCAGIGGDTLALADYFPVTAVDLSPIRTACLAFNAQDRLPPPHHDIEILTADIHTIIPTFPQNALVHIDPARRSSGKRSPYYQDLIPPPEILEQFTHYSVGSAIKLSPAVDFDSLPPGHLELISEKGTVVQAVLWQGALAHVASGNPANRTATVLRDKHPAYSLVASPEPVTLAPNPSLEACLNSSVPLPPYYFYELNGAITRAGLAGAFAQMNQLLPLTSDGGYLLSHELPRDPDALRALTPFQLLALLPFSEKRVAQALLNLPADIPPVLGPIEVKSRGGKSQLPGIDTDHLQKFWSGASPHARTVLLFAFQNQILAAIANRM